MAKNCSVSGCTNPSRARSLCWNHYQLWRRGGATYEAPLETSRPDRLSLARVWLNEVALTFQGDACLEWPFTQTGGYGQISHCGKARRVNRLVCEETHGKPPTPEHQAAHSCGNSICVNPHHLRWATPKENSADTLAHGTVAWGEKNARSKLTKAEVLEIKSLIGRERLVDIAKAFGVSPSAIDLIKSGKNWSRLEMDGREHG